MTEVATSSTETKQGGEAEVGKEVTLLSNGKRNLLCGEIPTAVNQLQEACRLLAAKYGDLDDKCGEAYLCYGTALLDLSRMESGVLGNALQGIEGENEDSEAASGSTDEKVENPDDFTEEGGEEREKVSDQVIDAMLETDAEAAKRLKAEKESKVKAGLEVENGTADKTDEDKKEDVEMATEGDKKAGESEDVEMEVEEKTDTKDEGKKTKEEVKDKKEETKDKVETKSETKDEKEETKSEEKKDEKEETKSEEKKDEKETKSEEKKDEKEETKSEGTKDIKEVSKSEENKDKETKEEETKDKVEEKAEEKTAKETKVEETKDKEKETKVEEKKAEETKGNVEETKVVSKEDKDDENKENKDKVETKAEEKSDKEETKDKKEEEVKAEETKPKDIEEEAMETDEKKDSESKTEGEEVESEDVEGEEGDEEGEGDIADDDGEGETSDGKKEKDEEDVSNLQIAWETLELAKIIYSRHDTKEMKLKAAQAYLKLGEVGLETEQYEQAIGDLKECLKLQQEHLEPESRLIAETHYQIGLACSFNTKHDEALEQFRLAVKTIQAKIAKLKTVIEEAESKSKGKEPENLDDPAVQAQKEVKDLEEILPDILAKIEDTVDEKKNQDKVKEMVKENIAADLGSITTIETKKETVNTIEPRKVSDITHLVRKKRKPDEEAGDEETKKAKTEKTENGSGDASNGVNGKDEEIKVKKAEEVPADKPAEVST